MTHFEPPLSAFLASLTRSGCHHLGPKLLSVSSGGVHGLRAETAVGILPVSYGCVTHNAVKDFEPSITEFPVVFPFQQRRHGFAAIAESLQETENTAFSDV